MNAVNSGIRIETINLQNDLFLNKLAAVLKCLVLIQHFWQNPCYLYKCFKIKKIRNKELAIKNIAKGILLTIIIKGL